jgi:predicted DsbA family dithiol-disulfide isomerase
MKVEIWSDVVCPWCGLGKHRLGRALAQFPQRDEVEVVHRSFLLDPGAEPGVHPVRDHLARKYRLDDAQLDASFARIESLAAAEGLVPYHVGDNVTGNTRLAHELLALASERGVEEAAWKRIYRAYFGERRSIFDLESLVELGRDVGLDPDETRAALSDHRYRAKVDADDREARALGATGVPFVVIDRRYGVSGAQPTPTFLAVLEQAFREQPSPAPVATENAACGPDGCELPRKS